MTNEQWYMVAFTDGASLRTMATSVDHAIKKGNGYFPKKVVKSATPISRKNKDGVIDEHI